MIKTLAKNKIRNRPTTQSNTEQFTLVKRKTNQKRYKMKNKKNSR